jgi:hypothetical protein
MVAVDDADVGGDADDWMEAEVERLALSEEGNGRRKVMRRTRRDLIINMQARWIAT